MEAMLWFIAPILSIVGIISYLKGNTPISSFMGCVIFLHLLKPENIQQGSWGHGVIFGMILILALVAAGITIDEVTADLKLKSILKRNKINTHRPL